MRSRRQALGQHFLHHRPTIEKIIDLCRTDLTKHKPHALVEVGPGKLAITEGLLELCAESKIPLKLVERDHLLEETVQAGIKNQNATLDFMDAAKDDFGVFLSKVVEENGSPIAFISNLPYSASSQILAQLCYASKNLSTAIVMVQKEMADRMVARPSTPARGAFSLLIQSYFKAEACFEVGPGAFSPPPKVKSTVLRLTPLRPSLVATFPEPKKFESFCKGLFSGRRKMIRNLIPQTKHECFQKLGISGTERPEALELETVLGLFQAVGEDH